MATLTPTAITDDADDAPPESPRAWYRDRGLLWTLLACVLVIFARASFGFTGIATFTFRNDPEIQFYLSKMVADGQTPLIDFEHGWNAGGWYVGALLYFVTGNRPALWYFIWTVVAGSVLAYSAVALTGLRLGLKKAVVFGAVTCAVILSTPAHGKYAIPALWFAILTPVTVWSQRRAVLTRMALAFVTLWLHVELAIYLCAAMTAFDLLASRGLELRARLQRVGALALGGFLGVMTEFAFFAVQGLGPGDVSRQVFFGQTEEFPDHQFGWNLFEPTYFLLMIYPTALLLPFVPAIWRRLSDPARLAVLITLALCTTPIRRVGMPHTSAVSSLLVFQYVLVFRDLHASTVLPTWGRLSPKKAVYAVLGAGWFTAAVLAGFKGDSYKMVFVMIGMTLLAALYASRRNEMLWASTAAAGVLLALPIIAVLNRDYQRVHNSRPLAEAQAMSNALKPALAQCDVGKQAWIMPGPIDLYDTLGLDNPTRYFVFHYNFVGEKERVTKLMSSGEVKTIILPDGKLPNSGTGLLPVLESHYRLCTEVQYREPPVLPMQVWTFEG